MKFLARCSAIVKECCAELFPSVAIEPIFTPCLELEVGDAGSLVCQQIGAALRVPPLEVLDRLQACLQRRLPGAMFADDLLCVRVPRAELIAELSGDREDSAAQKSVYQLILPPPHGDVRGWAYARLAASCLWQAALLEYLGTPVRLISFPNLSADQTLLGSFREIIHRSLKDEVASPTEVSAMLASFLKQDDSKVISQLWLSTRSLPRDEFKAIVNRFSQRPSNLQAHFPEMDWFIPWSEEVGSDMLLDLNDEQLQCALFYFLRPLNAVDMDMSVPTLNENSNVLFWIKTLQRRITQISAQNRRATDVRQIGDKEPGDFEPFALIQPLMVRLNFFDWFLQNGAFAGEVRAFFAQLGDFLARSNRYLNEPRFRRRLSDGELSTSESNFVTGIHRQLSDMIRISTVWQEKLRQA